MILNDFRTVHRATADYELTIKWSGNGCKGSYTTWVREDLTFQLNEEQQELIDNWIKEHARDANSWSWKLKQLELVTD